MLALVSMRNTASMASPLPAPVPFDRGCASANARTMRRAHRRRSRRSSWNRSRRLVCSMLRSRKRMAAHGTVRYRLR
jgi:hypothetical protein